MNSERFDDQLRSAVLGHDENSVQVFDRNKAWRKSTGDRSRKTLAAVTYIAATVMVVLNIIWMSGKKAIPEGDKTAAKISAAQAGVVEKSPVVEKMISNPAVRSQHQVLINEKVIEITDQPLPKAVKANTIETEPSQTVSITNGLYYPKELFVSKPESTTVAWPKQFNDDMKITFIRGKLQDDKPQPDVRITFRRGSKVKTEIKNSPRDSFYYADERPFRLKFKN